jgi:hypothetical protein
VSHFFGILQCICPPEQQLSGDLISVWAFGTPTIIVNTDKAARELLAHRSANYGDRPRIPMLDLCVDLLFDAWLDLILPTGKVGPIQQRL